MVLGLGVSVGFVAEAEHGPGGDSELVLVSECVPSVGHVQRAELESVHRFVVEAETV